MKVDSWSRSQIPVRRVKRARVIENPDLVSQEGSVGSTGSRRSRSSRSRRRRADKLKKSEIPDVQQVIIVEEGDETKSVISEAESARLKFEKKQKEIRMKEQKEVKESEKACKK